MTQLPYSGNFQHYVQWNIPDTGYCLDAVGTIKGVSTGTVVHFHHRQQWSAPAPCANLYFTGRTCITQHEQWWDDNSHPFSLQIDRTIFLAKGLGMAFKIRQTVPSSWSADGRYYWFY